MPGTPGTPIVATHTRHQLIEFLATPDLIALLDANPSLGRTRRPPRTERKSRPIHLHLFTPK
ncbi:MAG: hypothetical protein PHT60_05955 [Acidiphilium sp.]|nr:hypothetical protein [Acidiphilium sp.]MDD4935307.1 hypothetical protein [Acidiphilium sp.]